MTNTDWRHTILDRLRERNKRECGFQEIVNNSEFLCFDYVEFVFFISRNARFL